MHIAIVSDIHANLAAWNAVLADISAGSADRIICLGDIVGYGPQPAEVLSSVYANVNDFVLGNHDAVVAGLMEPSGFNPRAQKLIEHTRGLLGARARRFFKDRPLSLRYEGFRFSHGSPAAPGKFVYVMNQADAMQAWNGSEAAVLCVGHTHIPRLHVLTPSGEYKRFKPTEKQLHLQRDCRYIVNCGSAGFPRDDDFRASYVTLDTEAMTLRWHRIPYDMQAFRRAVQRTYDEPDLIEFLLKKIDRKRRRPVRELIDFTPGRSDVSAEVTPQKELGLMKNRLRRWKLAAVSALILILLLGAGFAAQWRMTPRPHTIEADGSGPIRVQPRAGGRRHDYMDAIAPEARGLPVAWAASLSDARRQSVVFTDGRLRIDSGARRPLTVSLPPAEIEHIKSVRWTIEGTAGEDWDGHPPHLVLDYIGGDGSLREGAERIALRRDDGGGLSRTRTIPIPADTGIVRPHIHYEASGSITIDAFRAVFIPEDWKQLLLTGPHDLNRISARDLESIRGIGSTLAGRIVDFRDAAGGFESVEELLDVQGIGEALLEEIKKYVEIQ